MSQPLFAAIERFGPDAGEGWTRYVEWIALPQLSEVITLDPGLCPSLIKARTDADWDTINAGGIDRGLLTSLDHVRALASGEGRVICVFQNPKRFPTLPAEAADFVYVGCDLIDSGGVTSSLVNCGGGFPSVFSNAELSENGLLTSFERAVEIQRELPLHEPDEAHAYCDLFVIFLAPASRAP